MSSEFIQSEMSDLGISPKSEIAIKCELPDTECDREKTREKHFVCDVCKKCFDAKKKLLFHKEEHEEKKQCELCLKKYVHRASLSMHKRLHAGYECSLCGVVFRSSYSLQKHKNQVHQEELPHACGVCYQRYSTAEELEKHDIRHQWSSVKCEVCLANIAAFQYRRHLKKHANKKSWYSCVLCPERYKSSQSLAIHLRDHSQTLPIKCTQCSATFRSKTMQRRHFYKCHAISKCNAFL